MNVFLTKYPTENDWLEVKRRALVTVGKTTNKPPSQEWKEKILKAGHSPIRSIVFSFYIEGVPYYVSTHLARHIHAQPYIRTQRNDRQSDYDRTTAPQNTPVDMIWDVNAEELITIAHKRLCFQASPETREVVSEMAKKVVDKCPEFADLLVPLCKYRNGICEEFKPCGHNRTIKIKDYDGEEIEREM